MTATKWDHDLRHASIVICDQRYSIKIIISQLYRIRRSRDTNMHSSNAIRANKFVEKKNKWELKEKNHRPSKRTENARLVICMSLNILASQGNIFDKITRLNAKGQCKLHFFTYNMVIQNSSSPYLSFKDNPWQIPNKFWRSQLKK